MFTLKSLRLPGMLLLALSLLGPAPVSAQSQVDEVRELIDQEQFNEALQLANDLLESDPDDITFRFLKGLILTRLNQLEQARDVFISMTESHPELPEPYNNLAVIYASLGDFDQARQALQRAINTHPSYATAHENMGDIYAKLASQAYNQALHLDRENITAKAKLSLINDLFSVPRPEQVIAAQESMTAPAQASEEPPPTPEEPATPALEEPATLVPAEPALDTDSIRANVSQAVDAWSGAWSAQDVEAYLSHYGDGFSPPAGQSLAVWRQERRERVSAPGFIRVTISDLQVKVFGPEHAQATFTQEYQSDTYGDRVAKLLLFAKRDDHWLITQEATK